MASHRLTTVILHIIAVLHVAQSDQDLVDYLADNVQLTYTVITNYNSFLGQMEFLNTGERPVTELTWSLYFSNIRTIEPSTIRPNGTLLGASGLKVHTINGVLHKIEPTSDFTGFQPSTPLLVNFTASSWVIMRTDVMPNWYFTATGAVAKVMQNTAGEGLGFVTDFTRPEQWKRRAHDLYDPYTPEQRLNLYNFTDLGRSPWKILPSPVDESLDVENSVTVDPANWVIVVGDPRVQGEADFLSEKIGATVVGPENRPDNQYIELNIGDVLQDDKPVTVQESYRIDVMVAEQLINITGRDTPGVFYGAQSFLSLFDASRDIPSGHVVDYPRFPYRGMHLDVSRNFQPKEQVMKLLEAMAMYKLNKFHFHLTDDEGWRLEIPELPELTEVGAHRCHDLTGDSCIMPQLGSDPNAPAQFYTTSDYQEILTYATQRHIEVTPEFDMPGHCHAPINAMLARYRKYKNDNETKAKEFLLSDLEDKSDYVSIQGFTDNAVNPCIESTYRFLEHLVGEIIKLHAGIQPLTTFNFGGDEVPKQAWLQSPACLDHGEVNTEDLKEFFVTELAQIVHRHGLDLSGWEDGLMKGGMEPFNRSALPMKNVYGYFWDNIWEAGRGQRTYIMANNDYKAIISHATNFYYDHPYEPHPEDRGYYWATRIIPTRKSFDYTPVNIYENMDVDGWGRPIDRDQVCQTHGCEPLQSGKEDNIIGMQGQLWSETIRTSDQVDYMIFPRLLALAERSWHRATWEDVPEGPQRNDIRNGNYQDFANTLGHRELVRLEKLQVEYEIPPPGARITGDQELEAVTGYPGLPLQYSIDDGQNWQDYTPGTTISPGATVLLITRSTDRTRSGRQVSLVSP